MTNLLSAVGIRGYDVTPYNDTDLNFIAVPTIDEFVTVLQEGPGWIGAILHGSSQYIELACFPWTDDGKVHRNIMYNSANASYGGVTKVDRTGKCYCIQLDAAVYGALFNKDNETAALFAACNGMDVLPLLLPDAAARVGYNTDDPATTSGCTEYALVFNAMTGHEEYDLEYVPKTFGEAVSSASTQLGFVTGDDQSIQFVPWKNGDSIPDNGDGVTCDGLDFWITIRGDISRAPAGNMISSTDFRIENPNWTVLGGNITKLSCTVYVTDHPGWGKLLINCDGVQSIQCGDLVLNGANNNQIFYNLKNLVNVAADAGGFSVVGNTARWQAFPYQTSHFVVQGGEHPVCGPWHELGTVAPVVATESYSFDLPANKTGSAYPHFRLIEYETTGLDHFLVHGHASRRALVPLPAEAQLTISLLESRLGELAALRHARGGPLRRLDPDCSAVFYTIEAWESAVQSYVADYWHNWHGVDVYIETVDDYPVPAPNYRDAWRTHMRERIAHYYTAHGVRYVHFIGGASDWERWSKAWPEAWGDVKDSYDAMGYPPNGQPGLDIIPCFYRPDPLPRGVNTSWWVPWIPTYAPYKDITGDGRSDIALGVWPVSTLEELLGRAITMQEYNDLGDIVPALEHHVELCTGELIYTGPGDSVRVMNTAQAVEAACPSGTRISRTRESMYPDPGVRNQVIASRMNSGRSLFVFIADDSHRRYPCKYFDNTPSANPPFMQEMLADWGYPTHLSFFACGAGDFPRNFNPDYPRAVCRSMGAAPGKGANTILAPMTGTWMDADSTISVFATEELWAGNALAPPRSLAMSWTAAENRVRDEHDDDDFIMHTLDSYVFIGDPLSPIRIAAVIVNTHHEEVPDRLELGTAHPNPFNSLTSIRYATPVAGWIRLVIYDLAGRRVKTLVDEVHEPGSHQAEWRGTDERGRRVASGMYFYRLSMDDTVLPARKLNLVK
ncbi:MAG: FlgD immunoglobulin-like domain containing protein [bacterium]